MPTTIAAYYTDELLTWNNSIVFYNNEMIEFTKKFAEVIRRNSITGLAEKVEVYQNLLNKLSERFYQLQGDIKQQSEVLKTPAGTLVDDESISNETAQHQVGLRSKMQQAVKDYIEVKFICQNFLSGTLKK